MCIIYKFWSQSSQYKAKQYQHGHLYMNIHSVVVNKQLLETHTQFSIVSCLSLLCTAILTMACQTEPMLTMACQTEAAVNFQQIS